MIDQTPAQAAARAAANYGVTMYDEVAKAVAAAVLDYSDTKVGYRQPAHRDQWAQADYREHVRTGMRRQLFIEAADKGLIPVELPKETLRYLTWVPGGEDVEVPANLAESGDAAWENLEVRLSMRVRKAG
jgi:hypothetical protein